MNRREAIAALVAMPEIAKISAAPVRPKDVIVVELTRELPVEAFARIRDELKAIWPDQQIVVCAPDVRLKVLRGE